MTNNMHTLLSCRLKIALIEETNPGYPYVGSEDEEESGRTGRTLKEPKKIKKNIRSYESSIPQVSRKNTQPGKIELEMIPTRRKDLSQ